MAPSRVRIPPSPLAQRPPRFCAHPRRGGRAVECGGLENRYPSLGGSRVQIPPPPLLCPEPAWLSVIPAHGAAARGKCQASRVTVRQAPNASATIVQASNATAAAASDILTSVGPLISALGCRRLVAAPSRPSRRGPSALIWSRSGVTTICHANTIPIVVPREPTMDDTAIAITSDSPLTSPSQAPVSRRSVQRGAGSDPVKTVD